MHPGLDDPLNVGSDAVTTDLKPRPSPLWIGVGCERGTPAVVFTAAMQAIVRDYGLAEDTIVGVATIDTKATEMGVLALCQEHALPLRVFSAERLSAITVPTPSIVVAASTGTPSVAEAAALLACWEGITAQRDSLDRAGHPVEGTSGRAIAATGSLTNSDYNSVPCLCVPKQIFRMPGQPGAVTIAAAHAVAGLSPH